MIDMKKHTKTYLIPMLLFFLYFFIPNIIFSKIKGLEFKQIIYLDFYIKLGIIFVFLIISYFLYGFKISSIDNEKSVNFVKGLFISISFAVIIFITIRYWTYIIYYITGQSFSGRNGNIILRAKEIAPYIVTIQSIFFAPIIEEFFYRQILFGLVYDLHEGCNKYVKFITAMFVSGLVFALSHFTSTTSDILYFMFAGFFLSTTYIYTKRIYYPILVHMIFNALVNLY